MESIGLETRPSLKVLRLGLKDYLPVWTLQKEIQQGLMNGTQSDTIIFCEHQPVITLGRSSNQANILISREQLQKIGVDVYEIERGGDVSWHGPGQLVIYPLLNLNFQRRDVNWYLRSIEEVIIKTLKHFDIIGLRVEGKTGVWTQKSGSVSPYRYAKIASIGVRISKWCTLHGCSLNIKNCSSGFSLINPCGYKNIETTSIEQELGINSDSDLLDRESLETIFLKEFIEVFKYQKSEK